MFNFGQIWKGRKMCDSCGCTPKKEVTDEAICPGCGELIDDCACEKICPDCGKPTDDCICWLVSFRSKISLWGRGPSSSQSKLRGGFYPVLFLNAVRIREGNSSVNYPPLYVEPIGSVWAEGFRVISGIKKNLRISLTSLIEVRQYL